jgi:predicted kinase
MLQQLNHNQGDTMPTLIVLCGLPFAGKSTLARALAAHTGYAYLSLDAINSERGVGLAGAAITPAEWDATYAEAYRRIERILSANHSLIYDETNLLRRQRDAVRAIAARVSAHVVLIHVTTPADDVQARWQANRQQPVRGDVRDEDFAFVLAHFEPPSADEQPLVFDGHRAVEHWIIAHAPSLRT